MREKRSIVLFFIHTLRFIIIMQSIDRATLDGNTSLPRVLRKFSNFSSAFPSNKKLMDCLRGDVIWFKHDAGKCKLLRFYKSTE